MKIKMDKLFLINQRLLGWIGCLGGIDEKLQKKENKSKKRKIIKL